MCGRGFFVLANLTVCVCFRCANGLTVETTSWEDVHDT